jgi:large subunit ribosomal protein L1
LSKHGKTFLAAREQVDRERDHTPAEAIALIKALPGPKFNETVEVHVRTGLNVRHADEQLRGTIALPNGLGKEVRIAVFAQGDKAKEAEEAGADVVGAEDLAKRVEQGFTDFDVAIATPDMMPVVGRLGRVLGPQAAIIDELIRAKPSGAKGRYLRTITLASTMGPGVKVDPSRTRDILEETAPATVA